MTLQSSGAISLSNIASEMGGSTPHSLSEYYKGGGLVGNHANNPNVPTSGTISFSNFYGANNTAPSTGNTAIMTAVTYNVAGDKYQQSYTGYNGWTGNGLQTWGSASDTTMDNSSGTSIDVVTCSTSGNTIVSGLFHFRVLGNFANQSFVNAFGYSGIKWGGTKVATFINAVGSHNLQGGSNTFWLGGTVATPNTSSNQTVEFTN